MCAVIKRARILSLGFFVGKRTSQSVVWWNVEKNVPELSGVILLIVLMLGASTPGLWCVTVVNGL